MESLYNQWRIPGQGPHMTRSKTIVGPRWYLSWAARRRNSQLGMERVEEGRLLQILRISNTMRQMWPNCLHCPTLCQEELFLAKGQNRVLQQMALHCAVSHHIIVYYIITRLPCSLARYVDISPEVVISWRTVSTSNRPFSVSLTPTSKCLRCNLLQLWEYWLRTGRGKGTQERRQSEDAQGSRPGIWERGVSRAVGGVSQGDGFLAGVGWRPAEPGALAGPGQVPWAGQTNLLSLGLWHGQGRLALSFCSFQGCSWHKSPLEADHTFPWAFQGLPGGQNKLCFQVPGLFWGAYIPC